MAKNNDRKDFFSKCWKLHGEVRKAEVVDDSFQAKDGKQIEAYHIDVMIEDDNADCMIVLVDKALSHENLYKRGDVGTFTVRIDCKPMFGVAKYEALMHIIDFEKD